MPLTFGLKACVNVRKKCRQVAAAMHDAFMPAFIAGFTEAGDLLSQWRG